MGKGAFAKGKEAEPKQIEVYIRGKVVDVTKFAKTHPGGAKALHIFANRDATEQFDM